jgi:hypothetical protein
LSSTYFAIISGAQAAVSLAIAYHITSPSIQEEAHLKKSNPDFFLRVHPSLFSNKDPWAQQHTARAKSKPKMEVKPLA